MGGECFKRLKEAEGIVAAFLCSLVYTALLASNKQLQSLDWPYFFISGSAALLVSLFNLAHLWWRRLLHVPSDVKWVILRGSLGSTSNCLSVFAVLAGAHVGSIAALRSANSIVASLGTVALGEEFGWMHLVSVTLFVLGAVLTADPEEVLATLGSTLLGNGLALASGICNGCAFLTGRKVKDVHPSFLIISNTLHTWILCWTLHFVLRVPDESFQSMEGVHLQSIMFPEMFRRCCHHRHHRYEHAARLWPGLFAVPASGTASDLCGRDSDLPGGANHAADASEAGFCQGQAACGRGDIESVAAGY
ncbi:unnamed protein product [Effrenium voratum]|uniref:Uncharacterized protein n=1 Tax=Effrenium voratum TaxID=2562239 RepID=A0AA36MWU5_9DINO|nr:unnamed protein product [Effrenium voratum]